MPGLIHPITGQPIQPGTEEEITAREERQQWRTTNAEHLAAYDAAQAAFRMAIRTEQADHTDLATALKAEIDNMVTKAREGAP